MNKTVFFQLPDGRTAHLYELRNANGMTARISDFGGAVAALEIPGRGGKFYDVALGHATPETYIKNPPFFGALVGRYANRIKGGAFEIDGKTCRLPVNNHRNTLHGGDSYGRRLWNAVRADGSTLELELTSPDGDAGFPGNLTIHVVYTVTPDNTLRLDYRAVTDAPTYVNFTNHLYFNLSGEDSGTIADQFLRIGADRITETDDELIPTGKILPVEGTPFDLRNGVRLGDVLPRIPGGFDDNFIFDGSSVQAAAWSPKSGIRMTVTTTEPAVQLYTAGQLDGTLAGKRSTTYGKFAGFCLETQHYADSPHHPEFPSTRLEPGQTYRQTTGYRFEVAEAL